MGYLAGDSYDLSGGSNAFDLATGSGSILGAAGGDLGNLSGGYESGSGFWTTVQNGISALGDAGRTALGLYGQYQQSQSGNGGTPERTVTYRGQNGTQARPLDTTSGGAMLMPLLLVGGLAVLAFLLIERR